MVLKVKNPQGVPQTFPFGWPGCCFERRVARQHEGGAEPRVRGAGTNAARVAMEFDPMVH